MEIERDLEDLYVLQDSITHLNAQGKEESDEAMILLTKRKELVDKIVEYVTVLAEWGSDYL